MYSEEEKILRRRKQQKEYYQRNKDKIKAAKLQDYYKNRDRNLKTMSEYRDKYIKPYTGIVGTGNYNITLAERHKEEWLKEQLFLYHLQIKDIDGTVFYKYGLTKDLTKRLYYIPYEVIILSCEEFNKYEAIYKEKELLYDKVSYIPLNKFGGHTECFLINNN